MLEGSQLVFGKKSSRGGPSKTELLQGSFGLVFEGDSCTTCSIPSCTIAIKQQIDRVCEHAMCLFAAL
jgi:hypothetical protein